MSLLGKILVTVVAVIVILVAAVWYFGNPPAADTAQDHGWARSTNTTSLVLVTIPQVKYSAPGGAISGGAYFITVGNFPLIPEGSLVKGQVVSQAAAQGVTLTKTGTQAVSLLQLGSRQVSGTTYDATLQGYPGVTAKALEVDFACPNGHGYVVGLAYGTVGQSGGAFGIQPTYSTAVDILQNVQCG